MISKAPTGAEAVELWDAVKKLATMSGMAELKRSNLSVSLRGDTIRVAPYLYNNGKDMDALVYTLETALK